MCVRVRVRVHVRVRVRVYSHEYPKLMKAAVRSSVLTSGVILLDCVHCHCSSSSYSELMKLRDLFL